VWREDIGALAIGRLDDDGRSRLEAHLEECPTCQADVRDLATVADLLADLDVPVEPRVMEEPPPQLLDSILTEVHRERWDARRRRRRRAWVATAGALAAAIVALVAIVFARGDSGSSADQLAFTKAPPGARVTGTIKPAANGSVVTLRGSGMPKNAHFTVWVARADGIKHKAGDFAPGQDGQFVATFHSEVPKDDAAKVWATVGGKTQLLAPLPGEH
jgi:anti-sigma factor RsiW